MTAGGNHRLWASKEMRVWGVKSKKRKDKPSGQKKKKVERKMKEQRRRRRLLGAYCTWSKQFSLKNYIF